MSKVQAAPAPTVSAMGLTNAGATAPYVMPRVEVGQVVNWSQGRGDPRPAAGVVVKVGTQSIAVAVHIDNIRDHLTKTGVRHVSDPFLDRTPAHDSGVWELTARDKRINALLESFDTPAAKED